MPLSVSEISALDGFVTHKDEDEEWGILIVGFERKTNLARATKEIHHHKLKTHLASS